MYKSNYAHRIVAAISFTLCLLSTERSALSQDQNDIFSIITIERDNEIEGSADDNYYWITFLYSNVSQSDDDSFWQDVRNIFVDDDNEVVFQIQQEVSSGGRSIVKAGSVLSIFSNTQDLVSTDVAYGKKLIPERRFQNSDSITVRASLSEVSRERASILRSILGSVEQVPLVNSFTNGTLTVASNVIDSLTEVTKGPGEKRQIGRYTIQGADALSKTGYIAIVSNEDKDKFAKLAKNPSGIPKTLDALNNTDKNTLPSFVLLKINASNSLYSPNLILTSQSPIRSLIKNDIDAIKNAKGNSAKAEQCRRLRATLRYLGPLSSLDEGYAAMAAMKDAKYNPEASAEHENLGCLTYQEIENAKQRYPAFKWGPCRTQRCSAAKSFVNLWLKNKPSSASSDTITWTRALGEEFDEGLSAENEFRQKNRLMRRWGDLKSAPGNSYSILGTMLGTKDKKRCKYDIKAIIGLSKEEKEWKVDSVNIHNTNELLYGEAPSINFSFPSCISD